MRSGRPSLRLNGVVAPRLACALALLLALGLAMVGAGCGLAGRRAERGAGPPSAAGRFTGTPEPGTLDGQAPTHPYPVGERTITLTRTAARVLTTTIWYPQEGGAVAAGRFPVVVFSHGLHGLPVDYAELGRRWAAAGFVVVAPVFPHTSRGAKPFDVADVRNQPADASFALTSVLALDTTQTDPLRGHLRTDRLAAAGHSAGGVTTLGLFMDVRDPRLDAGIVLAGNATGMGRSYVGDPATLLFVHGDADPVTPYGLGRLAYGLVPPPWPKAFLTLPGEGHLSPYVFPGKPNFAEVAATTTDFLRWTLYGDASAQQRLASDAGAHNRLESASS